jgi:hypothetical protein
VEAFNKILKRGLTKVCCANQDDVLDEGVPVVFCAYWTTTKRLDRYTPFQLVYVQETVVNGKFLIPSLFIAKATMMIKDESISMQVEKLLELEEARFLEDFH